MKKGILMFLVVVFAVVCLTSCKKDRTFAYDGEFMAYETSLNYGAPQVTFVKVTIKNDKIEKFFIDARQSVVSKNEESVVTGSVWNAKTKKELGYDYYMFPASNAKVDGVVDVTAYKAWLTENGKKEWFEQANLLEAAFLANLDTVALADGKYSNVAGVTVSDAGMLALAKKAVQNAKDGVLTAIDFYGSTKCELVMATAKVDKDGKISDYKLDQLQSKVVDGANAWNAKTKQELGYGYLMHKSAAAAAGVDTTDLEAYKTWLTQNSKKEWFEQAALICEEFAAKGSLTVTDGKFTGIASVSISDNKYNAVLTAVKACVK